MENRQGWTEGAITEPWPGFELCSECDGSQLCNEAPHAYCSGWRHMCGGAGQWPLDPTTRYFTPAVPLVNLAYLAEARASSS